MCQNNETLSEEVPSNLLNSFKEVMSFFTKLSKKSIQKAVLDNDTIEVDV